MVSIVAQWQLEVSLNHLVAENDEHSISDVSDVPIGRKLHTAKSGKWGGGAWILWISVERGTPILSSVRISKHFQIEIEFNSYI